MAPASRTVVPAMAAARDRYVVAVAVGQNAAHVKNAIRSVADVSASVIRLGSNVVTGHVGPALVAMTAKAARCAVQTIAVAAVRLLAEGVKRHVTARASLVKCPVGRNHFSIQDARLATPPTGYVVRRRHQPAANCSFTIVSGSA